MEFRSHLSRARGLGASREGIQQWWGIRISGLALVPLTLWFVFSVIDLAGADLDTFKAWVSSHSNPALLILLIITMFHHAQMGVVEVIEDYIHGEKSKLASIILTKFICVLFGTTSILAILKITFGG